MFDFTREERQVILFISAVVLVGLGINFALKINSSLKKAVTADSRLAKIDLNRVAAEELLRSNCLSRKLAEKIIAYRLNHGVFHSLEELKEVQGVGDYRYEKLKELFFVE